SHATYYFIAAGCYVSLGNRAKAQELLDALPELLSRTNMGGKDVPTEVRMVGFLSSLRLRIF
ncbi:hypothetical protein FB451DRAFT_1032685, partial [Mycena latifolia]